MKRCARCKIEKPEIGFHRNNRNPDGREYACKECRRLSRNADTDRRTYQKRKASIRAYWKDRRSPGNKIEKEAGRMAKKRTIDSLTDGYIRQLLTSQTQLQAQDIPEPLVAIKRLQIQILRAAKDISS